MNLNVLAAKCGILNYEYGNIKQWIWPVEDKYTFSIIMADWINTIRPFLQNNFDIADRTTTVIQAGGNCGVYPLLFTEFFGNVITFEPDPLSFFCLVNNCQLSGIVKVNAAISDKPGFITMKEVSAGNRGMNKAIPVDNSTDKNVEVIPSIAIDSFEYNNLKLIQFDLEGNEIKAINGAIKTIEKHKPTIILECGNDQEPENVENYHNVVSKMEDIGYENVQQLNRLDVVFRPK